MREASAVASRTIGAGVASDRIAEPGTRLACGTRRGSPLGVVSALRRLSLAASAARQPSSASKFQASSTSSIAAGPLNQAERAWLKISRSSSASSKPVGSSLTGADSRSGSDAPGGVAEAVGLAVVAGSTYLGGSGISGKPSSVVGRSACGRSGAVTGSSCRSGFGGLGAAFGVRLGS